MAPFVYLASENKELIREVRSYLVNLAIRLETGGIEEAVRLAGVRSPQVLISDSLEGAWEVRAKEPTCQVILLTADPNLVQMRAAFRSGVQEVLRVPDELAMLPARVEVLLSQAGVKATTESFVVAVYSGSGGMGRTTLAVALARAYAKLGLQTLLIDASLVLGGVDHHLGISPPTTLANLLPVMAELDAEQLGTATVQVQPSLDLLCSPADSFIITKLMPDHVRRLLAVARQSQQIIVVDMPSEPGPLEMVFLQQADQIAYLMTASPEAIRILSHLLVALEMEGVARSKIGLVHRLRLPAGLELAGSDVARQVGLHFLGTLPHDWSRSFQSKAQAARGKERPAALDQAAQRLAVRLAALSGVSVGTRKSGDDPKAERHTLWQPLTWLKGGFSLGGRR